MCAAVSTRLQRNSFVLCMSFGHFFCVLLLPYQNRTNRAQYCIYFAKFLIVCLYIGRKTYHFMYLYTVSACVYVYQWTRTEFSQSFPFAKARTKGTQIKMNSIGKKHKRRKLADNKSVRCVLKNRYCICSPTRSFALLVDWATHFNCTHKRRGIPLMKLLMILQQ